MSETTVSAISYVSSDNVELQGKQEKAQKYLDKGYYVKEHRNGYWVLVKPAQLNVTLSNGKQVETFNMKQDVCDYYGKKRISNSLIEKFRKDVNAGKISLTLDRDGYSFK